MQVGPIPKDVLIGLDDGRVHLCTGSESPLPHAVVEATARHVSERADGASSRFGFETMLEDLRTHIAALLLDPGHPERVAFLSSTGHGIDMVARLIGWRPGDNIVTLDDEFPSVMMAWSAVRGQGVTMHAVSGGQDPEAAIMAQVDPHTRAVCVSHVSFRTGVRLDLQRLSDGLRPRGILLIVDASHSLGVLAIDSACCDAIVSCGHKFLLGLHGTGILYLGNDSLRDAATESPLGWYSVDGWEPTKSWPIVTLKPGARSLEIGNPAFLTMAALLEGVRVLENAGLAAVEAHAMELAISFRRAIVARGLPCMTPSDPARHGSSIAIPYPIGKQLHVVLEKRRILTTDKGGRLRVSFHGFNTQSDLEAVLQVLDEHIA